MNDQSDRVNQSLTDGLAWLTDRAALHHEAIAEGMGINPVDLRCVRLSLIEPDMTPGRLAEVTGLTSGAVTGVLDRLERAGFVRREADPRDRRRTLVRVSPERSAEIDRLYRPGVDAIEAIVASYDEHQVEGLRDFVQRAGAAMELDARRIRAATRGGMVGEMFTAPLGDASLGRLMFKSGAPRIALRAAPLGPAAEARMVAELAHTTLRIGGTTRVDELCRATFTGPVPEIRARGGDVMMHHKRRLDPRERVTQIALNDSLPWVIDVSGGLSALEADLRGRRLRQLDVSGSVDAVGIRLAEPDGTSRVRISGGVRDLDIEHPAGSALRFSISGGIGEIRFERERMAQVQGKLRLETANAGRAADRFEVEVSGGARSVIVRTT